MCTLLFLEKTEMILLATHNVTYIHNDNDDDENYSNIVL